MAMSSGVTEIDVLKKNNVKNQIFVFTTAYLGNEQCYLLLYHLIEYWNGILNKKKIKF